MCSSTPSPGCRLLDISAMTTISAAIAAGAREGALHLTVFADACLLEHENVLHLYLVAVQSEPLADGDDLPRPVPRADLLHDAGYSGRDLFPDGPGGEVWTRHHTQHLESV